MNVERKPFVAGNWKMYKTVAETSALIDDILLEIPQDPVDVDIVICPPFTALKTASDKLSNKVVRLGAQNMFWEKEGAFTGEVSAPMLRDLYCWFVILGHSERRQHFGETNAMINKKARAAVQSSLRPIVCVGETLDEREKKDFKGIIRTQIQESLKGLTEEDMGNVLVAYEPVWAIGTGKVATPTQAQEIHALIRDVLREMLPGAKKDDKVRLPSVAEKVRIIYGGSVKPANAKDILSEPDIDGVLVGGASLDPRAFGDIIKAAT
ncbi:MAG: triose-phosphate isomerase [Verrucomicrobiae bacterium]|nr:triose-phosphate isomerase [Verrucomicrobiae bacterium]